MHTADLVTKPFSNDSPVLFLDNKEKSDNPLTDQIEHQNIPSMEHQNIPKNKTPSDHDQSPETPPPMKKKYEIMKDPAFLSSPNYPPIHRSYLQYLNSPQPVMITLYLYSLQIASLSNHNSLLYICIQLITPSNSVIKTKIFSLPSLLKLWHRINTGLTTASKNFLFNLISSAHPYVISKLMKTIRLSSLPHKKPPIF